MTELRNVILVVWLALGLCACSNPEADRALIEAAKGGNLEQVNLAISDWGNVNAKGGKLMATPLHYATVHGHTPLHDAATFGRVDAAGMLLAHEADVNALTPEEESPLDYAIEANAEEVVELLRTNGGKTGAELSIHTAAKRGDLQAIQQHLDAGVDVNQLDESGATPLDYAAKREMEETADFLRKRGGKTSTELREERKKLAD